MTAPHPEGNGAVCAITDALSESCCNPYDIDFIMAHGTATPDNDKAEIAAFKKCFSTPPLFTSLKGAIGHTLAASGALEVVYGIESLQRQQILPTVNFTSLDEDLLAPVTKLHPYKAHTFLKTAFGFGGNNGALVVSSVKKSDLKGAQ